MFFNTEIQLILCSAYPFSRIILLRRTLILWKALFAEMLPFFWPTWLTTPFFPHQQGLLCLQGQSIKGITISSRKQQPKWHQCRSDCHFPPPPDTKLTPPLLLSDYMSHNLGLNFNDCSVTSGPRPASSRLTTLEVNCDFTILIKQIFNCLMNNGIKPVIEAQYYSWKEMFA